LKKIIIIVSVIFLITGCQKNKSNNLDEILKGFSFVNNGNEYVLKLQDGNSYSFIFDKTNKKNNYFYSDVSNNKVFYYFNKNEIIADSCKYFITENKYQNCNDVQKNSINQSIKNYNYFLDEMKITQDNLNITQKELKNKIIKN